MKHLIAGIYFVALIGHSTNEIFLEPSLVYNPYEEIKYETPWEEVRNKHDIRIYSQWITLYDGYKTRRLKGNFRVNLPLPDIIQYLKDGKHITDWMNGAENSYTLEEGENEWISYAQFNIPWPFDDQDLLCHHQVVSYPQKGINYIYMKSEPKRLPVKKGINRMDHFAGHWKLTPLSANMTKIEYAAYSKSEPLVARWIQDPIVLNSFWTSLDNLANELNNQ